MFKTFALAAVEEITGHWSDVAALPAMVMALHVALLLQLAFAFCFLIPWICLKRHELRDRTKSTAAIANATNRSNPLPEPLDSSLADSSGELHP